MNTPVVARLYRRLLTLLPRHVRYRDLPEMVDTFGEMWREARGPWQSARVIMVVLVPFPRLWLVEWWDVVANLYSGDPVATAYAVWTEASRRSTPLPPIAVRVTPLALALVMCAGSVVMASRFEALAAEVLQEFIVLVTALFAGLAFLVVVSCSNAMSLLKPTTSTRVRRR